MSIYICVILSYVFTVTQATQVRPLHQVPMGKGHNVVRVFLQVQLDRLQDHFPAEQVRHSCAGWFYCVALRKLCVIIITLQLILICNWEQWAFREWQMIYWIVVVGWKRLDVSWLDTRARRTNEMEFFYFKLCFRFVLISMCVAKFFAIWFLFYAKPETALDANARK